MLSRELDDFMGAAQQELNPDGTLGLPLDGPMGDPAADIEELIREAGRTVVKALGAAGGVLLLASLF